MAFRNIIVESPARICVKNRQLVIHADSDHSAALEDISALLLENRQTTITAAVFSQVFYKKRIPETIDFRDLFSHSVLPYQEMRGNYNYTSSSEIVLSVLPYQEMRGNYNYLGCCPRTAAVLPYQEMRGN